MANLIDKLGPVGCFRFEITLYLPGEPVPLFFGEDFAGENHDGNPLTAGAFLDLADEFESVIVGVSSAYAPNWGGISPASGALLAAGLAFEEWVAVETGVTVAGSLLLAGAHVANWRGRGMVVASARGSR